MVVVYFEKGKHSLSNWNKSIYLDSLVRQRQYYHLAIIKTFLRILDIHVHVVIKGSENKVVLQEIIVRN